MAGSIRIGKIAGIDLHIHWTFSLLIVGVLAFYLMTGNTVGEALFGLGLILVLFVCVVLHELGHALTARRYQVPTRDITLYPIGGVARLQQIPEEPRKEFWISIAGPAVNLAIAALLYVGIYLFGRFPSYDALMEPGQHFFAKLLWFNVALVGFNLLPAFPMDGGRVLRAVLAMRMDYMRATQVAASIGQGMAILFGFFGFVVFNPILIFIALFVFLGAQQESHMTMMRVAVEGVPVRQAMVTHFETLAPENTLDDAVAKLLSGSQQGFPVVVENQEVVGVLTRQGLVKALAGYGRGAKVGDVMQRSCPSVEETEMLEDAFLRMQEARCSFVPVLKDRRLVGLLTLENVGELMMINSAMKGSKVRSDWGEVVPS